MVLPSPTPPLGWACVSVPPSPPRERGPSWGPAAAGKEKPAPHASCLASTLAEGGARGRRWGKGPRPLSDTSVENMKKSLRLNLGNNVECDTGRGTGAVVTQRLLCASVTKAPQSVFAKPPERRLSLSPLWDDIHSLHLCQCRAFSPPLHLSRAPRNSPPSPSLEPG